MKNRFVIVRAGTTFAEAFGQLDLLFARLAMSVVLNGHFIELAHVIAQTRNLAGSTVYGEQPHFE